MSSRSNENIPIFINRTPPLTEIQSGLRVTSSAKKSKGTIDEDSKQKSRVSVDEFKLGAEIDLLVKANKKNEFVQPNDEPMIKSIDSVLKTL